MNAGNGEGKGWLAWLATAMTEVKLTEAHDVGDKVDPKDKVIGNLPDDLVRMRAVSFDLAEQLSKLTEEHGEKFGLLHRHVGPECDAFNAKSDWLRRQAKLVADIFWASAIYRFDGQNKNLAVRKGNILVETPEEDDDDSPLLRATLISIPVPKDLAAMLAGLGGRARES